MGVAMTMPVNFTGGTTPVNATTHTLAGRPAASSRPHDVIFVSDLAGGMHQISDGATWLNWNVDALKAPRAVDSVTVATKPTAAAAGAGKVVLVTDLNGGTYQQSDGTNWATLATDIINAIRTRIGVRTDKGLPKPTVLTRRTVSSTIYINPTLGSDANAGTVYTLPRQTLPGTLVAGTAYLIIDGGTMGGFTVGQNGTLANPIVIGVYNPANGARIADRSVGRVTITGQVNIGGRSYVDLEHLNVTGGNPRIAYGGSANCQVICCRTNDNAAGAGMSGYWGSGQTGAIAIDGCEASSNQTGIEVDAEGGADVTTGTVIQLCTTSNNKGRGIKLSGGRRFENCHIAENFGRNNSNDIHGNNDADNGIYVSGIMRNGSSIRWNDYSGSIYSSLWVQPSGGSWHTYDCGGLVIENNKFSRAQYGMALFSKLNGTFANPVLVQYNDIAEAGTRDGTTVAHPTQRWGRGIEIFAPYPDLAHLPQHIICRYNFVRDTQLWDEYGTDAQGIGLDDNTRDISVYGNLLYNCGGQGIQAFTTFRPRFFANICIGNAANTVYGWEPRPRELGQYRAEIAMGDTEHCLTFGNAAIARRTGGAWGTRYAIVGGSGNGGNKTQVHNNLACNAAVCGIVTNLAWADTDCNHYRSNVVAHREMNGFNNEEDPIPLTANESFSTGPASTDPLVQAAAMSQTLFDILPSGTVTAVAPPAALGQVHGGALTSANTSFIDVSLSLPENVEPGKSIHVAGFVWSVTQATNRVTGLPTMTGETFQLGAKTAPLGEIESYAWVVPSVQTGGTGKTATIRITREDNSFWSFYIWQGPPLASSPVDTFAAASQSGLSFTQAGGANTTQAGYVAGLVVHNDFLSNRAVTFTTDAAYTEIARRIDSNPAPSSIVFSRSIGAASPVQLVTSASVAPVSWWHGVAVAYRTAGNVAPSITTGSTLPASAVGDSTPTQIDASGTRPMAWSIQGGALTPGRSLNGVTGQIIGTRAAPGTFTFTVRAVNSVGSDSRTFTETVTAAAGVPSGVTVTALSATSLRVTYADNSTGETGFEIRRKVSPNGTILETVTKGPNVTTHDFTDLSPSTTYWFDVRATAAAGNSAYSAEGSGTTQSSVTLYAQFTTEARDRLGADINGSTGWTVAVWTAPGGSNLVGVLVGQYTGQAFEGALVGGEARMRVPLGAASGTVTAGQALRISISDGTRTTGIISGVVAA